MGEKKINGENELLHIEHSEMFYEYNNLINT